MQEKSAWKVFEFGTFSAQFFSIWTEHGDLLFKSPFSPNATKIWNMDQKNSKYGFFLQKKEPSYAVDILIYRYILCSSHFCGI